MYRLCAKEEDPEVLQGPEGLIFLKDVEEHFDGYYDSAWRLWQEFKTFGLPHGRGYLGEKPIVIQLIALVERAYTLYRNWAVEKESQRRYHR